MSLSRGGKKSCKTYTPWRKSLKIQAGLTAERAPDIKCNPFSHPPTPRPGIMLTSLAFRLMTALVGLGIACPVVAGGTEEEALSSFRIIGAGPSSAESMADVRRVEESTDSNAVWLAGIIQDSLVEESREEFQSSTEPAITATEPIPSSTTLNSTALAAYEEDRLGFQEAQNAIEDHLQAGQGPATPSPDPCLPLEESPAPWLALKSTSLSATWLPGSGDNIGMSNVNLRAKITSPRVPFLSISPSYQMTFLNGPDSTDVPGTLHQASLGITGMLPLSKRLIAQANVSPGISSDFQNTSSESIRTSGMGMLIFAQSSELQWMFGVVYLNRDDVRLLPAVGLNWSPDARTKLELTFPRPRFLRQIAVSGETERWGYLAAEFGGGTWAIERTGGVNDVVTIRDYRLLVGMEYRQPLDRSWFWETGLVIGREVDYSSNLGSYSQDPTVFLRGGLTY